MKIKARGTLESYTKKELVDLVLMHQENERRLYESLDNQYNNFMDLLKRVEQSRNEHRRIVSSMLED